MVILACSPCQYVHAFGRWLVNRGDTIQFVLIMPVYRLCRDVQYTKVVYTA